MNEGIIHPPSKEVGEALLPYLEGFINVTREDGVRIWAKLKRIDPFKGVVVYGYTTNEAGQDISWVTPAKQDELFVAIKGIFPFDRGGEFEIFGIVSTHPDGTLMHAHTPFNREGRPITGEKESVNYFYTPGSTHVPEEILKSSEGK